jgi:N-acetylglucosamine-6-phosphate deacetylase
MAAAGSADGDYRLGDLNVSVTGGQALLSGTGTIAGSTLTQDAALRIAITEAGVSPEVAVAALTSVPARALGIEAQHGLLRPGHVADAVLLDSRWHVLRVWACGAIIPTDG